MTNYHEIERIVEEAIVAHFKYCLRICFRIGENVSEYPIFPIRIEASGKYAGLMPLIQPH
jgi:hypothetical protein